MFNRLHAVKRLQRYKKKIICAKKVCIIKKKAVILQHAKGICAYIGLAGHNDGVDAIGNGCMGAPFSQQSKHRESQMVAVPPDAWNVFVATYFLRMDMGLK